ncbi:MAG: 2-C-methyl-D-erythritol 4-phosphate cytidylyltransferase, partial [Vicinamibacterales bacterium]
MHVTAIIAAGGHGARFGADQPKQLLLLGGRPILDRAVEVFAASPLVQDVIVALPAAVLADPPAYLRRPKVRLVEGGETR